MSSNSNCVDQATLLKFQDSLLPEAEETATREHLATCPRCASLALELVELAEAASRFAATRPAGSCPDSHRIGAYAEGQLAAGERTAVESHLAACGHCAADLAALTRELAGLELDPGVETPAWAREQARAMVEAPAPRSVAAASVTARAALAHAAQAAAKLTEPVEPAGFLARALAGLRAASFPVAAVASLVLLFILQLPAPNPPGLAVRGGDELTASTVILSSPVNGGELANESRILRWEPAPGAGTYSVTVVDATGALVWTGQTDQPWFRCPAALPLATGVTYAWWVETLLESGVTIDSPVFQFTLRP